MAQGTSDTILCNADSHAYVQMRRKVRGLRKVEQAILDHQHRAVEANSAGDDPQAVITVTVDLATPGSPEIDSACDVVLEYCAAVCGILNDDQGGLLHPPGLRMAEALGEVRDSIQRNLDEKEGSSGGSARRG